MKYITPHQVKWAADFKDIRDFLVAGLAPSLSVEIHHVGSTAVPGMPAKDIIDIDIECSLGDMAVVIGQLRELGYEHMGDQGIPGREAFNPVGREVQALKSHHLYACEADSLELARHLAFRDYLRSHPERAGWLAEKKIQHDSIALSRQDYIDRKAGDYRLIVAEATA